MLILVTGACQSAGFSPTALREPTTTSIAIAETTSSSLEITTSSLETTTSTTLVPLQGLALEVLHDDLERPIFATAPPGDDRLFVLEREGRILLLGPDRERLEEPFLDLTDLVGSSGIEQGLLGMAFHPDYPQDGRFFLYFTDRADDSRLMAFRVSADDPDRADPESGELLLMVEQPAVRHNAGMLRFGPDGLLYVGLGDGGAGTNDAQRPETLLGSILRIDVDGGEPYAIPPANPFVAGGGAPEVWVHGLRNPWRFDIDPVEQLVYIGDVGQLDVEEIDVIGLDEGGANFGWPVMEGSTCFLRGTCDASAYVGPVLEYTHQEGCSVTGGFVYRGSAIPELTGHYFYSDWCVGWIRSFRFRDGQAADQRDWSDQLGAIGQVNSFGVDGSGELYVMTWGGTLARLVPIR